MAKSTLFIISVIALIFSLNQPSEGWRKKKKRYSDLIPVQVNKKYGYKTKKGKIVIKPQFDEAGHFYNRVAMVLYKWKVRFH